MVPITRVVALRVVFITREIPKSPKWKQINQNNKSKQQNRASGEGPSGLFWPQRHCLSWCRDELRSHREEPIEWKKKKKKIAKKIRKTFTALPNWNMISRISFKKKKINKYNQCFQYVEHKHDIIFNKHHPKIVSSGSFVHRSDPKGPPLDSIPLLWTRSPNASQFLESSPRTSSFC
jgi:hypothetical protein